MKTLFLGDIHGCWQFADATIADAAKHHKFERIIQVGDFGFFPNIEQMSAWDTSYEVECWWIDGNHDNHDILQNGWPDEMPPGMEQWVEMCKTWSYKPRGTVEDGILFIGGAKSIDRSHRVQGVDWWPNEIHSWLDQENVLHAIDNNEIHTVVSHDCPQFVAEVMSSHHMEDDPTRGFLWHVFDSVRPDNWLFGHHHQKFDRIIDGTRFRCLDMMRPDQYDYEVL